MKTFVAEAPSNIALVKYWGKRDALRQWPANDSLSMTLEGARTETSAAAMADAAEDRVTFGGELLAETDPKRQRVVAHLDFLRTTVGATSRLAIDTRNTFPAGSGIASSASGFAALTIAATAALTASDDFSALAAAGFDRTALARLARLGSGSAARSIYGGYVHWQAGETGDDQRVTQVLAQGDFDLGDVIAIVSAAEKPVSSSKAHAFAWSSPLFATRLSGVDERLTRVEAALRARDFSALGREAEAEALEMHAVIMTATPSVNYLAAATRDVLAWVREERAAGRFEAYFTLDAGPNVHILTRAADATRVANALRARFGGTLSDILIDRTGGGPKLRLASDAKTQRSPSGRDATLEKDTPP